MLLLKPKGRGNWRATTLEIKGPQVRPLMFRIGASFELGGVSYRICKVIS